MNTERTRTNRIRSAWDARTASPDTRPSQGPRGQCAVTALLVQDWYGGEILRAVIERTDLQSYDEPGGTESHYWNLIPGMGEIDLTRDQYPATLDIPRGEIVPRSRLLEGERAIAAGTERRYLILKRTAES